MYKKHTISVIIPCRNEGKHLKVVIKRVPSWVDEVIVVSNKSTDNTVAVARKLGVAVYEDDRTLGGIGYGYAHMTGIKKAKGSIIVGIDGDGTYPVEDLATVIDHLLAERLDFVSCNRYPLQDGTKIPFKLQAGVQALNIAVRVLYGFKVKDILSGMWVFRKTVRTKLGLTMGDWNLSPQIKINAATKPSIRFAELSIKQHVREGETKQHYFATGFSHVRWLLINRFKRDQYIIRFVAVGAIGFIFNYCLLSVLHKYTNLGKVGGEAVSMLVSVQVTFFLHDRWTYAGHQHVKHNTGSYLWGVQKRYVSYVASNGFSALLTVVIFALLSTFLSNFIALALAGAVSMVWNFVMNKVLIWRSPSAKSDESVDSE
jgi:glycosyltransferase involved in cell wall biosynthesis